MNDFRHTLQTEVQFSLQPSLSDTESLAIASGFLFLFCLFILIASLLHYYAQREEAQIKAAREQLERIWQANSNLEH
jgi:hypothetical protein